MTNTIIYLCSSITLLCFCFCICCKTSGEYIYDNEEVSADDVIHVNEIRNTENYTRSEIIHETIAEIINNSIKIENKNIKFIT